MKTIICPELLCVFSESSHQLIKLLISQLLNKMFFFSFFFNPVQRNEIETCSTQVIQNFMMHVIGNRRKFMTFSLLLMLLYCFVLLF